MPESWSIDGLDRLYGSSRIAAGIELLARDVLGMNATTWTCLESNRKSIIEALLNGAAILIPYDADWNSKPVLWKGKKAHWCTGFGFRVKLNELSNPVDLRSNPGDLTNLDLMISLISSL